MAETASEHREFNWVEARSNCTVDKVFERLKEEFENDLDELRKCRPDRALGLNYVTQETGMFGIESHPYGVLFDRTRSTIEVSRYTRLGERTLVMRLSIVLNDKGECMLVDETDETRKACWPWQIRRRALEELFFELV